LLLLISIASGAETCITWHCDFLLLKSLGLA
jgi:hypothetical protein